MRCEESISLLVSKLAGCFKSNGQDIGKAESRGSRFLGVRLVSKGLRV